MIAIISATKKEVEIFSNMIVSVKTSFFQNLEVTEGIFLNERVVLIMSGVGIRKAKNAATFAATKYKPGYILSVGFSGALCRNLNVGDIVIGEEVVSLKEEKTYKLFSDFPFLSFDYKSGVILSESRFISNKKEKEDLYLRSGAISVDMETWGVANVVSNFGINVISVRTISDNLEFSLPKMGMLFNSDSKLSTTKCFKYFLKNPAHLTPFLRFKFFNLRKAKIRLNHFLTIFLPILAEMDL